MILDSLSPKCTWAWPHSTTAGWGGTYSKTFSSLLRCLKLEPSTPQCTSTACGRSEYVCQGDAGFMVMTNDGIAEIPSCRAHGIQQQLESVGTERPRKGRNLGTLQRRRALNSCCAFFDHVRGCVILDDNRLYIGEQEGTGWVREVRY